MLRGGLIRTDIHTAGCRPFLLAPWYPLQRIAAGAGAYVHMYIEKGAWAAYSLSCVRGDHGLPCAHRCVAATGVVLGLVLFLAPFVTSRIACTPVGGSSTWRLKQRNNNNDGIPYAYMYNLYLSSQRTGLCIGI